MRIMALLTMVTISVVAIFGSLALKSWSADLEAKDEQAFTKHIKHKLNPILWETHFAHKLELNQITFVCFIHYSENKLQSNYNIH